MTITTEQVVALAKQSGAFPELSATPEKDVAFLVRFAELVRKQGIEELARESGVMPDLQGTAGFNTRNQWLEWGREIHSQAIAIMQAKLEQSEARVKQLWKDTELVQKIICLCDGGRFDLADSPKSFMSAVQRLLLERAAMNKEQSNDHHN